MLFFVSFVFAKNYCIERTYGKCEKICQNLPEKFDATYYSISFIQFDNISNDEEYNLYIADETYYNQYWDHLKNFKYIFCDPSIYLTIDLFYVYDPIRIKDHIYFGDQQIRDDIRYILEFSHEINIEVDTDKMSEIHPVILRSKKKANFVNVKFFVPNFPENLISISSDSYNLQFCEKTERIEKLFNDTDKLEIGANMSYYCISDKEVNKCPGYSFPSMKYITSSLEIANYPSYVVVDSSIPQIFTRSGYIHIVGLSGSDIICKPLFELYRKYLDNKLILNSNSIEMDGFVYEGEGNITISTIANFSFVSTSKTNNFHLSLKTLQPFAFDSSFIFPIHEDDIFDFDNKINVLDYTTLIGPKKLNGLFENKDKFLNVEDLKWINITVDDLKEYDFDNVNYYFKGGDVEIPVTWRKSSFFSGNSFTETNLIFSDVYSFDGQLIDHFMDVTTYDQYIVHNITIKPAKYFYFDIEHIFAYNSQNRSRVIKIIVHKDFYMFGHQKYMYDKDFIIIKIIGKGTIYFEDQTFYEFIINNSIIDDSINLIYSDSSSEKHNVYACVGQSDLNKCKSKISEIGSLKNYEWIWLRNLETTNTIGHYINIEKTFFTENLTVFEAQNYFMSSKYPLYYCPYNNITLTPDADLTIITNKITLSNNSINNIFAQKNTSKLTCILYNYSIINLTEITIDYYEPTTDIDFKIYFYDESVKFKMKYVKDFIPNSIKIYGKSNLYIRDYLVSRTDMFQKPDSIIYLVNYINDHEQVCFSEEPIDNNDLYDYFLTGNYEDFAEYINISNVPAFVYSDINFLFFSDISNFRSSTFYIYNNITTKFDVPNDVLLLLFDFGFSITLDKYYRFYNRDQQNKLVFNVNECITLDVVDESINLPTIEFSGHEHSVDVFLFPSFRKFNHTYTIVVNDNLKINSPYPQHICHLFGQTPINFSPRWNYLYLSEEGKKFYQSNPYDIYNVIDSDETLEKNIVLAVGKDEMFSIPSNWKKQHNIYIVQEENDLFINMPASISYQKDGLHLNDNILIISGKVIIYASNYFNFNIDFSKGPGFYHYLYEANIDCSLNKQTDMYVSYINNKYYSLKKILIYGYSETSSLTIHMNNDFTWSELRYNVDFYSEYYFDLRFSFDSICYYHSYFDRIGNCSKNSLIVHSNSNLNKAIFENPLLPVVFGSDIVIPYTYGTHLILNPRDPNVKITLPSSPKRMSVLGNKTTRFEYKDSTIIDVINKSKIFVELIDTIDLNIKNEPNSTIIFDLGSNVLVTTQSQIKYNFNIFIIPNSNNLYTEDLNMFGNIFRDELKQYIKVCAHDSNSKLRCTFDRKEPIESVFNKKVNYQEIEIAISFYASIKLPKIFSPIKVNILPVQLDSYRLAILYPVNVFISSKNTIVDDYWLFEGNKQILEFLLDKTTSISVTGTINDPIILELNNYESTIYLINFDKQDSQIITIKKFGSKTCKLTVYGTQNSFNNFKNSLFQYSDIRLIHDTTQRYVCLCIDEESCEDCQDEINGVVTNAYDIISDPGEKVNIRVFYHTQLSSTDLTNEHKVFIDVNSSLILTNVDTVYQNIDEGIKFDNLWFNNESYKNLIVKPKKQGLNIFMKKYEAGPALTVEVEKYLKLNVINANDRDVVPSRLYAKGRGELNIFDYPYEFIWKSFYVKVIKGIYTVCYGDLCVYNSNEGYKTLGSYNNFAYDFDPNAKIIVYLSTFKDNIDANLKNLKGQKIEFVKNVTNSNLNLLENQNKLRFTTTTELINKDDSTTELLNSIGGALLDSFDSDLFIVGFDENLTIKQEGNLSTEIKKITIQPMNDRVSIFIDESVDIEKQKIKIETENDKEVQVTVFTNKNIANDELLKNFIETDENKVNMIFSSSTPTEPKKKGLPIGGIIGIVIGVIVIVAIIVVVVFFIMKNNNNNPPSLSSDSNQFDDSTF